MNIINIKNLDFKYKDKMIFEKLSLNIKKNSITTILGKNGSGKTTLAKMLAGEISSNIIYNDEVITKKNVYKKILVVNDVLELVFTGKTVKDYLNITIKNMDCNKNVEDIIKQFKLLEIINENPNTLSVSKKQLISIAAYLSSNPDVLVLDNSLVYLDEIDKNNIIKILKKSKKEMTIILITQDIEDTLISDQIIVIDKKVVVKGNKEKVYKEEKILNSLGFNLPFMVELSNRLKFYNLIDETIYDKKKMVDTLWK